MPFKKKKQYNRYMKTYMQDYRQTQKKLKLELQSDTKAMQQLASIPKAYELIFGKKPKRR